MEIRNAESIPTEVADVIVAGVPAVIELVEVLAGGAEEDAEEDSTSGEPPHRGHGLPMGR